MEGRLKGPHPGFWDLRNAMTLWHSFMQAIQDPIDQQMCQGIWDVVIYHHLSHIGESNNDAYLKYQSLLKWMKMD